MDEEKKQQDEQERYQQGLVGNDDDLGEVGEEDALEVIEVDNDNTMDVDDDGGDGGDDGDDDDGGDDTAMHEGVHGEEEEQQEAQKQQGDGEEERQANASAIYENHTSAVFAVAVSPDGKTALSGSQDDTAVLFNLEDGQIIHTFKNHSDSIIEAAFSRDGSHFALGCMDGAISVWSKDCEKLLDLELNDDLTWMYFHPMASFLLAGSAAGGVVMWAVPSGTMFNFFGHQDAVACGAWFPSGRSFVSGGEDGKLLAWSPKSQEITCRVDAKAHQFHQCPITVVACHPDNVLVATGGPDGAVRLTSTKTGKVVSVFEGFADGIEAISFSASNPVLLAIGALDGSIAVFNPTTKLKLATMKHEAAIVQLTWHPQLPVLYSCSADGTVAVWDARSGEQLHACYGHTDTVLRFALVDGGKKVLSGGDDHKVMLFDVPNLPTS